MTKNRVPFHLCQWKNRDQQLRSDSDRSSVNLLRFSINHLTCQWCQLCTYCWWKCRGGTQFYLTGILRFCQVWQWFPKTNYLSSFVKFFHVAVCFFFLHVPELWCIWGLINEIFCSMDIKIEYTYATDFCVRHYKSSTEWFNKIKNAFNTEALSRRKTKKSFRHDILCLFRD